MTSSSSFSGRSKLVLKRKVHSIWLIFFSASNPLNLRLTHLPKKLRALESWNVGSGRVLLKMVLLNSLNFSTMKVSVKIILLFLCNWMNKPPRGIGRNVGTGPFKLEIFIFQSTGELKSENKKTGSKSQLLLSSN